MRKTLLGLLAATALVAPAPASANSTNVNHCRLGPTVLYAAIVVYSDTTAANPVTARVTCTVWLGSSLVHSATFTGTGLVYGASQYPYVESRAVTVCTYVEYLSTGDPSGTICTPDPVGGFADIAFNAVFEATKIPDPVLCPVIGSLAPGIPGVVRIEPGGDVGVYPDGWIWDCPPYDKL